MSNQDCDKFRVSDKHNNIRLFLCGFNRAIQNRTVLRDGGTYLVKKIFLEVEKLFFPNGMIDQHN